MQRLPEYHPAYFIAREQGHATPTLDDAYEGHRQVFTHRATTVNSTWWRPVSVEHSFCAHYENCAAVQFPDNDSFGHPPCSLAFVCRTAGKQFVPPYEDPQLKLGGLLALNLHEFSSDVEEIADQVSANLSRLACWHP